MKNWQRVLLIVIGLALIVAALTPLHWYLTRDDRIAATKRFDDLRQVRDELLRYEDEHGVLPKSLDELTPQYLRRDQVYNVSGEAIYRYQPDHRLVAERSGAPIRGLFTTTQPPCEFLLPPMQTAPVVAALLPLAPVAPVAPVVPTDPPVVAPILPAVEPPVVQPEPTTVVATPPVVPVQPAPPPAPQLPPEIPVTTTAILDTPRTGPFADGRIVIPVDPGFKDPPAGALVFEAESYTDTNYGWEIHLDEKAAGGAYLHCKEGIANGPAQLNYRAGNFYDVKGTTDLTYLRYHFHLPKDGKYYIYGRMWTTDTHCSNNISVSLDSTERNSNSMDNRTPFRWLWSPVGKDAKRLKAGDHYLHLFIHEDGIRVDQYILSPVRLAEDAPAFKANFHTGEGTAFAAEKGPPVAMAYDLKSMIFTPTLPVDCKLSVRRIRPASGVGHFKTVLLGGGKDGGTLAICNVEVDLAKLPETCLIPLSFKDLEPEKLPRREYILQSDLLVDGQSVAQCHIPLVRPYAWEIFGPGGFLRPESENALDGNGEPKAGDKRTWMPFAEANFDHFGVLDFGVLFDGNMKHPRENATVYAQTRVEVPVTDTYLLKLQADDQMILWLDGQEIFRHDEIMPVTRGVDRHEVKLEKGVHTFRYRLNQYSGPWQAYMMIRAKDDDLCGVVGLPLIERPAAPAVPAEGKPTPGTKVE